MSNIVTEKADNEICKMEEKQVYVPIEVLGLAVESVEVISQPESSHPDWDVARQEDRVRAWSKYEILMAFIK